MQHQNENLATLLDLQQNELDAVASVSDSIDSRNLAILGANITLLLYIGQANFGLDLWQYLVLTLPFIISAAVNLRLIWPAQYYGNPDISVHPEYLSMTRTDLLLQLISNTQLALDTNSRLNRQRFGLCLAALMLSVLGVIILFGIIMVWAKQ